MGVLYNGRDSVAIELSRINDNLEKLLKRKSLKDRITTTTKWIFRLFGIH